MSWMTWVGDVVSRNRSRFVDVNRELVRNPLPPIRHIGRGIRSVQDKLRKYVLHPFQTVFHLTPPDHNSIEMFDERRHALSDLIQLDFNIRE